MKTPTPTSAPQPNPLPNLTTPSGIAGVLSESKTEFVSYLAAGFFAGVSFAVWIGSRFYNQSRVFAMAWPMRGVQKVVVEILA